MKAMVGLVIAILIIFGFRLFWPSSDSGLVSVNQSEISNESSETETEETELSANDPDETPTELNAPSDEAKTRLMRAEYEVLEQSRSDLKRHIARLKHEMWGLKFPPDTAKHLSKTVMGASMLLKNPHMLGAFSSVEQIKAETEKVTFAEKSLEEVDEIVKAKLEETAEVEN